MRISLDHRSRKRERRYPIEPSLTLPALKYQRRRSGYTLLEILVATVIALLLMSGLYVAFDVTLSQTDIGRGVVAEADFGRAVFNRMSMDLTLPIGPLPPKSGGGIDDQADITAIPSTSGTTTGNTTTGSTTTGTTTTGSTDSTGSTDTTASADAQSTVAASIPLQAGVVGTSSQLTMFVSKVPTWMLDRTGATADQQVVSDLRRITYYIHSAGGLCRQEKPWITADGVQNTAEPDRSNEADDLIAPEVSAMNIEYADGSGWVGSWDGSYPSTDGTSTQGPPRAIRITLTLDLPDNTGTTVQKQIQHVYAVRAAVGLATPPAPPEPDPDPATDPATTGGM